ncbi:hypothetical protein NC653_009534 [Populus alba x Populus x berolinensis]|uniref:Glycine-rich protein n=1 Tax=Populus alba x Populus x berolinensis TaxID=444605 RepID=A0AAD6W9V8_9ROSI|nr:hypothetical protein NC653_009534 [Populus alba x Populus x berolinensis]
MASWAVIFVLVLAFVHATAARNVPTAPCLKDKKNFIYGGVGGFAGMGGYAGIIGGLPVIGGLGGIGKYGGVGGIGGVAGLGTGGLGGVRRCSWWCWWFDSTIPLSQ